MAALSAAEVAVPSRSEAAAVSAAVRAAAARRTEEWLELAQGDPIDVWPAAGSEEPGPPWPPLRSCVSSNYSRSPRLPGDKAVERRSKTFVGLNFCK